MSDTGFVIAGLGQSVTGAGTAWSSPDKITADDGNYSIALAVFGDTNPLKGSTFGLSIPSTATINGIEVQIQLKRQSTGTATIKSINVGKSDGTQGTPVTPGTGLTSSDLDYTAGGATSLWGLTWSVSDVQASTFQVRVVCSSSTFVNISCDAMWVKVYYTASTGARTQSVVVF